MNLDNIEKIMTSPLWKEIIDSPFYRGYTIIDENNRPNEKRDSGYFFVLLVYFHRDISDIRLREHHLAGQLMSRNEYLTGGVREFYGTLRVLEFS